MCRAVAVSLVFSVLALTPSGAEACINEVSLDELLPTPTTRIHFAEKQLEEGHLTIAATWVKKVYPNIRSLDASAPPLALRAERVFALALVRSEGKLDESVGWAPSGNLAWAHVTLADLARVKKESPTAIADLAEAQIRLPTTRAAGVAALEELDRRDLLGSAHAYRALAIARAEAKDDGGVKAAMVRCAAMSVNKRHCELPSAKNG